MHGTPPRHPVPALRSCLRPALRATLLAGLLLSTLTACHITRPADPARRATAPLPSPDAWPDRDLDAVRDFHERTPDTIVRYELSGLVPEEELEEDQRAQLGRAERIVTANRLTEHGLFRAWERAPQDPLVAARIRLFLSRFRFRLFTGMTDFFSPNASFLSSRDATGFWLDDATDEIPDELGVPRGEGMSPFIKGLQESFAADAVLLDEGVSASIPDPAQGPGKGVIIVLGGYVPTTWEDSSIDLMEDAGWRILRVETLTSVRGPNEDAYRFATRERDDWVLAQMRSAWDTETSDDSDPTGRTLPSFDEFRAMNEKAKEQFVLPPRGLELTDDTDPEALGRTIAAAIDDAIAENAYAAVAAFDHYKQESGDDGTGPVVVAGFSAGSFGAPAVAARLLTEGHTVDAMILVGAGADIFRITQSNPYLNGGIDLTGKGAFEPDADRIEAVHDAYLRHTKLDPYAIAPALADIPTLLLIADKDRMVPTGALLDERLGKPRRTRYFGGHAGLFYFLPPQTPRIIRWLDDVTQTDD